MKISYIPILSFFIFLHGCSLTRDFYPANKDKKNEALVLAKPKSDMTCTWKNTLLNWPDTVSFKADKKYSLYDIGGYRLTDEGRQRISFTSKDLEGIKIDETDRKYRNRPIGLIPDYALSLQLSNEGGVAGNKTVFLMLNPDGHSTFKESIVFTLLTDSSGSLGSGLKVWTLKRVSVTNMPSSFICRDTNNIKLSQPYFEIFSNPK